MKYIKSYKIFESVGKIHFPAYTELHDFFVELEDDEITFPTVQPSAVLRSGYRPQIHVTSTPEKQIETVIKTVQELIKKGFAKTEIAIFYKQKVSTE